MKNKITLKVKGMHCKSCEMLLSGIFEDNGVKAEVSLKEGRVNVEFDSGKMTVAGIKSIIKNAGYQVV
jgi:copper chaperone CopZ